MKLKSIYLLNYRNYEEFCVDFSDNKTVIVGKNAQGKTNLLEAVCFLSNLKSFRAKNDKELINFGKDFFRIKGNIYKNETDINLDVWVNPPKKKLIKINDIKKSKNAEFTDVLKTVKFTTDDLLLLRGAPKDRRNWLDEAISQIYPAYFDRLSKYNRIKDQKNNLLKTLKGNNSELLNIWNEQLINSGSNIIYLRKKYIKEILEDVKKNHFNISEKNENLEIKYNSTVADENIEEIDLIAQKFRENLLEKEKEEIIRGKSLVGPHRDDIEFFINGNNAVSFASQGQQRTIVLALKIAEINIIERKTFQKPILLLDDVLAELDKNRQKFLFEIIKDDLQSIITTTDLNGFEEEFLKGVKIIEINKEK